MCFVFLTGAWSVSICSHFLLTVSKCISTLPVVETQKHRLTDTPEKPHTQTLSTFRGGGSSGSPAFKVIHLHNECKNHPWNSMRNSQDCFLVGSTIKTERVCWLVGWGGGVLPQWWFDQTYSRWRSRSSCQRQPGPDVGHGTSVSGRPTARIGSASGTGCQPAPTCGSACLLPPLPPRSGWGWDTPTARSSWSGSAGGLSLGPKRTAGVCLEHLLGSNTRGYYCYVMGKNRT